jgi:hypothetical protein
MVEADDRAATERVATGLAEMIRAAGASLGAL